MQKQYKLYRDSVGRYYVGEVGREDDFVGWSHKNHGLLFPYNQPEWLTKIGDDPCILQFENPVALS